MAAPNENEVQADSGCEAYMRSLCDGWQSGPVQFRTDERTDPLRDWHPQLEHEDEAVRDDQGGLRR
jgi:hypothetical protein